MPSYPHASARPAILSADRARLLRRAGIALLLALGVLAAALVTNPPANAVTYDADSYPLSFTQASRSAVSPGGATGKNAGDVMMYSGVATIGGVSIDAVVTTLALHGATLAKYDEGSAVTTPPPGTTRNVDQLFQPNMNGTDATESSVTFQFDFYRSGTYTGAGTGEPVTLANVHVNTYDIDSNGSSKQFNDFRGFQTYLEYTQDGSHGIDVSTPGGGYARFTAKGTGQADASSGSYGFARIQVNYDKVTTMSVTIGELGTGTAYYSLDFSAGGFWTNDGVTPVTPTQHANPANRAPTTSDVSINATRTSGTVLRVSDFPYTDADSNPMAGVTIVSIPSASDGVIQYSTGGVWSNVTAGTFLATADIEAGRLRILPSVTPVTFTFSVSDGLTDSASADFEVLSPLGLQAITFPTPATVNGTSSHTFASNATADSGLTPILTSQTPTVCAVSGLDISTAVLAVGDDTEVCIITATQPGDGTYGRAEPVTQQFSVTRLAAQTITFANPGDQPFGGADIPGNASSDSGLTVTLTSQTTAICTISGGSIHPVAPGTCTVTATQPGDSTYAPASAVTVSFELGKTPQVITFAQPSSDELVNGSRSLTATADSGLPTTLTSSTTAVCTVSGATVSYVDHGICTITASQAGDATHAAAADVARSFSITTRAQSITFLALPTHSMDDGPLALSASATSSLTVAFSSSTPAVCTVSGTTLSFVAPGMCTLTASQPGDGTWAAAVPVTHSFLVFEITTASLPAGHHGSPYSAQLQQSGGTGNGTWAALSTLPAGITLDPATGLLSGTATGPFHGPLTFSYTEGGATQQVALQFDLETLALAADPAAASAVLASTGVQVGLPVLAALAALVAGVATVLVARRRRNEPGRHRA